MTTHLRAVDPAPHVEATVDPPAFEGQDVNGGTKLKLSGGAGLEVDLVSQLDDVVRLYVEGRVTGVGHVVDEKSGRLMRVHTVKIVEALPLPWDFDTGTFE